MDEEDSLIPVKVLGVEIGTAIGWDEGGQDEIIFTGFTPSRYFKHVFGQEFLKQVLDEIDAVICLNVYEGTIVLYTGDEKDKEVKPKKINWTKLTREGRQISKIAKSVKSTQLSK